MFNAKTKTKNQNKKTQKKGSQLAAGCPHPSFLFSLAHTFKPFA
jgi:hypothetical protein